MTHRQLKTGYFVLEGLNAYATTFYFYYLFFYMAKQFGFGNKENLFVAALNGFVYMFAAWYGGKYAQKHGYFTALKLGFIVMAVTLSIGAFLNHVALQLAVMVVWATGMCFTWPTLEALVSENEEPTGLQRMVGIYNLVWAGCGAMAFFTGGALLEKLGPNSIFWLPVGIHLVQLGLTIWLEKKARVAAAAPAAKKPQSRESELELNPRPIARAKTFLRMAWLANPFAYVAINTVVAVIPGVARKLDLSPMFAGFFCSIWFFARFGTFFLLWIWDGWHYRFRWFIASYLMLIGSFTAILLSVNLLVIVIAQIVFGLAIGLIYYSSLYYSMDVGETKGEHGGFHEAAIGAGIFLGPAVGASALYLAPQHADSGTWAVSALLVLGFGGLLWLAAKK